MVKIVRLDDVAQRAGVSKNTASRVLNNRGYISEEIRGKVMRAVKDLNYYPNENARNLLRQKSGVIGLLVPSILYPHHAEIISIIERELSHRHYKLLLCNSDQNPETERHLLKMFQRNRVEGLITCNHELGSEDYADMTFPVVSIDRYVKEGVSLVTSNHRKGGRLAAEILLHRGCRHILQISSLIDEITPWNVRHLVFENMIRQQGVECRTFSLDVHLYTSDFDAQCKIVREQLLQYPMVDGFFASDLWAVAALTEARGLGKRVPQDLKIVGYDGTLLTRITEPGITTIWQDREKISRSAVEMLCQMIQDHSSTGYEIQHDVVLIERGSTSE